MDRHSNKVWTGIQRSREQPGVPSGSSTHVDAFIAMRGFSREKHREFGFPREMEVLSAFISDTDSANVTPDEHPSRKPYFLIVGRLERIKGLQDVIPVLPTMQTRTCSSRPMDNIWRHCGRRQPGCSECVSSDKCHQMISSDTFGTEWHGALRDRLGRLGYEAFQEPWRQRIIVPRYLDIARRAADQNGSGSLSRRSAAPRTGQTN